MKIRTGFVSNSSSSSFVAIIDVDAYKEAMKAADKYTKAVVKALDPKTVTVGGTDLVVISAYMGQGGDCVFDEMDIDVDPPIRPKEENETDEEYEVRMEDFDEEAFYPGTVFDEFLNSIPKGMIHQHTDYN